MAASGELDGPSDETGMQGHQKHDQGNHQQPPVVVEAGHIGGERGKEDHQHRGGQIPDEFDSKRHCDRAGALALPGVEVDPPQI